MMNVSDYVIKQDNNTKLAHDIKWVTASFCTEEKDGFIVQYVWRDHKGPGEGTNDKDLQGYYEVWKVLDGKIIDDDKDDDKDDRFCIYNPWSETEEDTIERFEFIENKENNYYSEVFWVPKSDFKNYNAIDSFEGRVKSAGDLKSWFPGELNLKLNPPLFSRHVRFKNGLYFEGL